MNRASIFRSTLVALAAVALPAFARAQDAAPRGPLLGVGIGISDTRDPDAGISRVTPSLQLRAGWALSRTATLMLEGALNGRGGHAPESFAAPNDPVALLAPGASDLVALPRSELVGTLSVLASLQVAAPAGLYVRPGIGVAQHTFGAWELAPDGAGGTVFRGVVSHEWGPAAGLAVGHDLPLVPSFPLKVEAVGVWSRGEDSTGPRWSAGVQLVHDIRF